MKHKASIRGWIDGHKDYLHWSFEEINSLSDLAEGLKKFDEVLDDLIAEYWKLYLYIEDEKGNIIAKFELLNK